MCLLVSVMVQASPATAEHMGIRVHLCILIHKTNKLSFRPDSTSLSGVSDTMCSSALGFSVLQYHHTITSHLC